MRRKPGQLFDLEARILTAMVRGGAEADEIHGFALAKSLADHAGSKRLTSHGTLYKALDRMRKLGYLESEWEDPLIAAQEGRPRRRFYSVTAAGEAALVQTSESPAPAVSKRRKGLAL